MSASGASAAGDSSGGAAAAAGESEIDRDDFSAQVFVTKLLVSGNLEALLKAERKLLDGKQMPHHPLLLRSITLDSAKSTSQRVRGQIQGGEKQKGQWMRRGRARRRWG
jgi:hypothetical protein